MCIISSPKFMSANHIRDLSEIKLMKSSTMVVLQYVFEISGPTHYVLAQMITYCTVKTSGRFMLRAVRVAGSRRCLNLCLPLHTIDMVFLATHLGPFVFIIVLPFPLALSPSRIYLNPEPHRGLTPARAPSIDQPANEKTFLLPAPPPRTAHGTYYYPARGLCLSAPAT